MGLPMWLVGVIISIVGSIFSNFGQNVQKFAMMKNEEKPEAERVSYTKMWRWWVGLLFVIFGSLGDFTSLSFAPQSVVMPVGSMTLVANLFFASMWLGETLTRKDVLGTFMIIVGASLVAVAYGALGTPNNKEYSLDELIQLYLRISILVYFVLMGALMLFLYTLMKKCEFILGQDGDHQQDPEYQKLVRWHPFSYSALSGVFGANSVLFAKSTTELIRLTAEGQNQFGKPLTYVIIGAMFTCIISQTHFLAHGLQFFDALYIIPVFQCFFITFSILGGAVYFNELTSFTALQWVVFLGAVGITLFGVILLSARDMSGGDKGELLDDDPADGSKVPGQLEDGNAEEAKKRPTILPADLSEFEQIWSAATLPAPVVRDRGKSLAQEQRAATQERMGRRSSFVSFLEKPFDLLAGHTENGPGARRQSKSSDDVRDFDGGAPLDTLAGRAVLRNKSAMAGAARATRYRGSSVGYDATATVGMGMSLFTLGYEKATGTTYEDGVAGERRSGGMGATQESGWDMGQINPLETARGVAPAEAPSAAPATIGVSVNGPPTQGAGSLSKTKSGPLGGQKKSSSSKWVKDPSTGRIYNADAIVGRGGAGHNKSAKF